jgi:hypothetical protein
MNCKAKIAAGKLMNANVSEAETYMNLLWTLMVEVNCYQEWLSHECSAKYQGECRISLQVSTPEDDCWLL